LYTITLSESLNARDNVIFNIFMVDHVYGEILSILKYIKFNSFIDYLKITSLFLK